MTDADTLARTIAGEARGDGEEGMTAVANVVLNRVAKPGWWGSTISGVCLKPLQFSCWDAGDPNRKFIEGLNDGMPIYRLALSIANQAVAGTLPDITDGATFYYAKSMTTPPYWARGKTPCAVIGGQFFFNDIT